MTVATVEHIMNRFAEAAGSPYTWLRRWKAGQGKGIVGCSPMQFPEELVHAAGMLPAVLQETEEKVTDGLSRVHPFFCGITRNVIDMAAKGQLDVLDGLLYANLCIQNANAALTLKQMLPPGRVRYVQLPTSLTREGTLRDAVRELDRTRSVLEEWGNRKVGDTALAQSIALYNRHRYLLRELHERCRRNPGLLSFGQRQAVVISGMVMPKEIHAELLEELLKTAGDGAGNGRGPRLFLSGHLCQAPGSEIVDLIEEAGARIVDDDLYTGHRYYAVDAETTGNPLENLAGRWLDPAVPLPTRSEGKVRWDAYVAERAEAAQADGVIVLMAKYCEPHLFAYPFIRRTLAARGIPHLLIETEHETVSLEGIRTRVQAFLEML